MSLDPALPAMRHLNSANAMVLCRVADLYIAVGSPIDAIGENYLFWVHMFQHILLMYVCPHADHGHPRMAD